MLYLYTIKKIERIRKATIKQLPVLYHDAPKPRFRAPGWCHGNGNLLAPPFLLQEKVALH